MENWGFLAPDTIDVLAEILDDNDIFNDTKTILAQVWIGKAVICDRCNQNLVFAQRAF